MKDKETVSGGKVPSAGRPIILAIETSGISGSIALVSEEGCIAEFTLQSRLTHSRRLLTGIDWLLQEAGLGWGDLAAIAVSLGPGSFTGLRIGLSTAKGLVMATGLPLLGVGALDGLAAQLAHASSLICPMLDARKNEVYAALYRSLPAGVERVNGPMVLPPADLAAMINEPVVLAGDGAAVYGKVIRERLGESAIIASAAIYFPRAAAIGGLAFRCLAEEDFLNPAAAVPLYVRASEAEILFGKGGATAGK